MLTGTKERAALHEARVAGALKLGTDGRVYPHGDSAPICDINTAAVLTKMGWLKPTATGWRLTSEGAAAEEQMTLEAAA
jgi:hypothetical protein